MRFEGDPIFIEIPEDSELRQDGLSQQQIKDGGNFKFCLENDLKGKKVAICFVLIGKEQHHPFIKKRLDEMGIISQFLLYKNISKKIGTMGVITNLLRQVNAKVGLDLYRISLPQKVRNANTMIVGVDVVNMGRKSIVGMCASYNEHLMQYYSESVYQELYKDQLK
jgi:hypothetical protein